MQEVFTWRGMDGAPAAGALLYQGLTGGPPSGEGRRWGLNVANSKRDPEEDYQVPSRMGAAPTITSLDGFKAFRLFLHCGPENPSQSEGD